MNKAVYEAVCVVLFAFLPNYCAEYIEMASMRSNCELFSITIPESITVENSGTLHFAINNYSDEDAKITVSAKDAVIDTGFYFAPAHTSVEKNLQISCNSAEAHINFLIDLGKCGNAEKQLHVLNSAYKVPSQIPSMPEPSKPNVQLYYVVSKENDEFIVDVSLRNMTQQAIQGSLFAEVPEGWQGNAKLVALEPFEEKNFKLKIEPKSGAVGTFNFDIVFAPEDALVRERVFVEVESKPIYTGFFAIATAGIAAAIILVIVVLIFSLFHKQNILKKEPWYVR